jgi:hypothetical protein
MSEKTGPTAAGAEVGRGTRHTRLRLSERLLDEIDRRVHDAREVTGGLLIGYPTETGLWVERVLPVRNAAPPEVRSWAYEIDGRIVDNVRGTLGGSHLAVLGFFYGGGGVPRGERIHTDHLRLDPDTIWLLPSTNGGGRMLPRVIREGAGTLLEMEVELLPARETSPRFCPE